MKRLSVGAGVLLALCVTLAGCGPQNKGNPNPPQPPGPPGGPVGGPGGMVGGPTGLPGPGGPGPMPMPQAPLKAALTFPINTDQKGAGLALSPDGALAVTQGKGIHLWDTTTGKEIPWQDDKTAGQLKDSRATPVFSADGTRLWARGKSALLAVNPKTHQTEESIPAESGGSQRLAVSPDGKYLATESEVYDAAAKKKLFDYGAGQQLKELAFSRDGKTLVGRTAQAITLWDVEEGKLKHSIPFAETGPEDTQFIVVSPTDETFAVRKGSGKDSAVEVRDLATGEVRGSTSGGPELAPGRMAGSPDGKYRAVAALMGQGDSPPQGVLLVQPTNPVPTFLDPPQPRVDVVVFSGNGNKLGIIAPPEKEGMLNVVLWDLTQLGKNPNPGPGPAPGPR